MNKKRLLAIIMTVMLIVGLLPLSTFAEGDVTNEAAPTESVKEEAPKTGIPSEDVKQEAPKAVLPAEDTKTDVPAADGAVEKLKDDVPDANAAGGDMKKQESDDGTAGGKMKKQESDDSIAVGKTKNAGKDESDPAPVKERALMKNGGARGNDPVYTVTIDPGSGRGTPIVFKSDVNWYESTSGNGSDVPPGHFYRYLGDGKIWFRFPDYKVPDTFTAPDNYVFDEWIPIDMSPRGDCLISGDVTFTAQWKKDPNLLPESSYSLSPTSYTITQAGYTDIKCVVTSFEKGKVESNGQQIEVDAIRFTLNKGTLTDGNGNSIPFLVDEVWHWGPYDSKPINPIDAPNSSFTAAVYINENDFNAAAPGTYTGTYQIDSTWIGVDPSECISGNPHSIALSLTIPDTGDFYDITVTNDGNGTASADRTKGKSGTKVTLTATANPGYSFKEWQVVSGNVTIENNQFNMPASAVELKAIFERTTVTFDANGGTVDPGSAVTVGGKLTSLPVPERTGWTFSGWYTEADGGSLVTTETEFTNSTTIYAHWYQEVTVTFDAQGGTVSPESATTVNKKITNLPTPVLDGGRFVGWFTEANGGSKVTTSTEFSSNTTIYARWGSTYTLDLPQTINITPNTEWTPFAVDVTKLSLSMEADGRTPDAIRLVFNPGTLVNQGDSSKKISFKLHTRNDTTGLGNGTDKFGTWTTANDPSKWMYIYIPSSDWTSFAPGTYQGTVSYEVRWKYGDKFQNGVAWGTIPVKLTIPGAPTTYTVTVSNDGNGSGTANPTSGTQGTSVTLTATPNPGYMFKEWVVITGNGGTLSSTTANPAQFTMGTGDATVQATFAEDPYYLYAITYHLDDGTNHSSNPATYTKLDTITLADPKKDGHTFGGWYDNASFSGSHITNIPAGSTGDKQFYAKWTADIYNLSYQNVKGASNSNPATYTIANTPLTLASLTGGPTGYTFDGWYDNAAFSGNAITEIPANSTGDKTYYAKWMADEYDIVFDPDGGIYDGKMIPTTEKHDYDETFTLTAATRDHYQFKGWKANDAAGTVYQAGTRYKVTGDVTFTAQWECDTIDITVNTIWKIPEGLTVDYPDVPVTLVASTGDNYSATLTEPYWVHTFEKLPEFDDGGYVITYSLGEIKLDHFDTFVGPRDGNSLDIINIYRPETVTVNLQVIKKWEDDNKTEERPDSIQIALYADNVMISDPDNLPVLTAGGGWEYDFTDLPKYKSQNGNYQEIEYKIVEVSEVADYTSSSEKSGYNWIIYNTYAPQQREVTVIGGTTNDSPAFKNDTVRIKANDPAPGMFFKCWESNDIGDDAFDDATAFETTFTMPAKEVTVKAVYNKVLIGPADGATDDPIADQVYTGSDIEPKLKVELEGVDEELIAGTDYDIKYKNNKDAGPAEAIVTLKNGWVGSGSTTFKITPANISTATVTAADQTYDGTEKKPDLTVTWNGKTLAEGTDYDVTAYADNKNAGKVTVTVTGKGNYTGTASSEFTIARAKATITVDNASKVEGASDPVFTGKVEGLIADGDLGEITYSRTGSNEAPGTYKGVLIANYTDNPNYDVTVTNGDFTITQKPADTPTYKAVSGSGRTYTKGSGKTLTFTYKRSADDGTTFSHFKGITVDGKAVPEKDASGKANWKAKSGSVIIELQSSYLETLSVGEHKLAVQFDDGADATSTFTVKAKPATPTVTPTKTATSGKATTTAPKTGDESNMLLWFLLICASLFVMFRIISLRNRRFYDR